MPPGSVRRTTVRRRARTGDGRAAAGRRRRRAPRRTRRRRSPGPRTPGSSPPSRGQEQRAAAAGRRCAAYSRATSATAAPTGTSEVERAGRTVHGHGNGVRGRGSRHDVPLRLLGRERSTATGRGPRYFGLGSARRRRSPPSAHVARCRQGGRVTTLRSGQRLDPPEMPSGQIVLQPPPEIAAERGRQRRADERHPDARQPRLDRAGRRHEPDLGRRQQPRFIAAGMFLFATLGFIVVQLDRQRKQRTQQVTGSRTEYLRYLAQHPQGRPRRRRPAARER